MSTGLKNYPGPTLRVGLRAASTTAMIKSNQVGGSEDNFELKRQNKIYLRALAGVAH